MSSHRARITEAEIDVMMAVNIEKVSALGFANEWRKGTCPLRHPVHRNTTQQRIASTLKQCFGLGTFINESFLLPLQKRVESLAIDSTHEILALLAMRLKVWYETRKSNRTPAKEGERRCFIYGNGCCPGAVSASGYVHDENAGTP